jgi:hypothetical protein
MLVHPQTALIRLPLPMPKALYCSYALFSEIRIAPHPDCDF